MSTTIDSKVVQMEFDNKQFERGIQTSLDSIASLKKSLNFDGVTAGFEELSSSAQDVDMTHLGSAVETVKVKFSALQVMALTAMQEISKSVYNAGKNVVKALTIDPIKMGFQEYETQINAVQTILANTSSKGTTLDNVNAALDTLNAYADKTIYNFTEMTRNIGTFTAAGIDLDTSVKSIQGIANLAAVSGSTSQQASTAMYQLSQALASGTVKLMDWNSVVNAGMGGQVFQDALKETARLHGVAIDSMIEDEGSFRETLKNEWLTSEILTETLEKFTMAAEEGSEQWTAYKKTLMDKGYTEAQATEILKLGNTATDAATKVKTFSQLMDTLKEAAQSGWTQTWEILIGDFEEAKELFTKISDFIGGFINSMSEARNSLLEGALGSPLGELAGKIAGATKASNEATSATKGMTKSLEEHNAVVGSVINGDWGNMEERWNALSEAGYDWALVQNLVNEKLGSSVRHASALVQAQSGLETSQGRTIEQLLEMSDAQLLNLGFTKAEVKALRDLAKQAKETGTPIEELINNLTRPSGRELLIESLGNIFGSLVKIFKAVGEAYREIFPPMSSDTLYGIIEGFHSFTQYLVVSDGTADKLKRTLKGIFAVIDIGVSTVKAIAGVFFDLVGVLTGVVMPAGGGLLDFVLGITANIGDFLVLIRDGFKIALEAIVSPIHKAISVLDFGIQKIKEFIASIKESISGAINNLKSMSFEEIVSTIVDGFKKLKDSIASISFKGIADKITETFTNLKDTISNLTLNDFTEIGKNLMDGLIGGFNGKVKTVIDTVVNFAKNVIDYVKDIFGIHSPSTVFKEIGQFIVDGLVSGLDGIADAITKIFDGLAVVIESLANGISVIITAFINGISTLFGSLFGAIGDGFENADVSKIVERVGSIIKTIFEVITQLINDGTLANVFDLFITGVMGSIGISITKFIKSLTGITDGVGEMINPFAELGENIADLLDGLKNSLTGFIDSLAAENKSKALMNIAKALAILAVALIALTFIDSDKIADGLIALGLLMTELGAFLKLSGLDKLKVSVGTAIVTLALGLVILTGALAILGNMDPETIIIGLAALAGTLTALGFGLKQLPKEKGMISTAFAIGVLATGLLTLSGVIAIMGNMDLLTLIVGISAIGISLTVIGEAVNKLDADGLLKKAASITVVAVGLMVLAGAVAIMGNMEISTLATGIIAFGVALAGLDMAMNNLDADGLSKKAASLVVISAGLVVMAGAVALMGSMSLATIAKGLIAMAGALAAIVVAMNTLDESGLMSKAASLVVISSALIVLSGALGIMGNMSLETIAKGLLAIGGALAELVIALNLMNGTLQGSAAMLVAAAALAVLTPVLITLGTFALVAAAGLIVIAGAFTVLGVAGLVLAPLTPVITALSASIALLGAGCLAAGTGLLTFSTALGVLALTGQAGGEVLITVFTNLIMLIPLMFEQIGVGLIALGETIIAATPVLVAAVVVLVNELLLGLLAIINTCIPPLMDTLGLLLDELIAFIREYFPKILQLGFDLLLTLLKGIRDNIQEIVEVAIEIVTELVDGIANKIDDVIECAINLILEFVNGLADGIEKHAYEIGEAANNLVSSLLSAIVLALGGMIGIGEDTVNGFIEGVGNMWDSAVQYITDFASDIWIAIKDFFGINSPSTLFADIGTFLVEGLIEGISDMASKAVDTITSLAEDLWDNVKDFFGINSPSKKFMEIGRFLDLGLAKGLDKYSGVVEDSATDVGDSTVNSMSKTLAAVSELLASDIDSQPTIRPVLDLSDVESGASKLDAMFSRTQAMRVNNDINAARNGQIQNGDVSSSKGNVYQFTQNNYSPKALSRIDIYRQTKNQFSAMKGAFES